MAANCSGEESGMSEKSIFRRVRRALAAARLSRADEADRFGIAMSPDGVRDHEHPSIGRSAKPSASRFRRGVLQVRAVECVGIQEDRHGLVERDAVFRRVGLGLPRVPLEHLFSIYGIPAMLRVTDQGGRHPCHTPDRPSAKLIDIVLRGQILDEG
jgi:hypothetical protein